MNPLELLKFYADAGIEDTLEEAPQNRRKKAQAQPAALKEPAPATYEAEPKTVISMPKPTTITPGLAEAIAEARKLADAATTLKQLEEAVRGFDGCALKASANKTVFSDGNPESRLMLIGEAPGANEDMQGIPFCGVSGQLLDNMLKAIGYDRSKTYITNTLFWRPPGNRKPTPEEMQICRPFLEKHVALVNPALLVLVGGTAVADILETNDAVGKLRLKFHEYKNVYTKAPIKTLVTFHPSYLLRSPGQKAVAWKDWLLVKKELRENA